MNDSALVVFSGGQDSTTCLGWALDNFSHVWTIGFDYSQRHAVEMECRKTILQHIGKIQHTWESRLRKDKVLEMSFIKDIGDTALTSKAEILIGENNFPTTFVPGRNLFFLTAAAAYAYRKGITHIVLGVCETDYSGYPDCRDSAIKAMQVALNIGMESNIIIHTPLMWIDKAETWSLSESLGGSKFIELIKEQTHTCYLGVRSALHDWGYGCGECPACELREKGWNEYSKQGQNHE